MLLFLALLLSSPCLMIAVTKNSIEELLIGVRSNNVALVKTILEESDGNLLDVKARDGTEQTPLMAATLSGSTDVVKYLLSKGADVTIGEKDSYTPFHGGNLSLSFLFENAL